MKLINNVNQLISTGREVKYVKLKSLNNQSESCKKKKYSVIFNDNWPTREMFSKF